VLTEAGLGAALKGLAQTAPVPVRLAGLPAGRLPTLVEAAVYFMCSEAVTNAAKHAGAEEVVIDVAVADGRVTVTIADDGRGGASLDAGSGLRGLRDRIEAVDGRLDVRSPSGGGTCLRAELPVRSGDLRDSPVAAPP
jgi:signal transduction histidine kinase